MAVIERATDMHDAVTDRSQGFPHAKLPATGVELSIGLTADESTRLTERLMVLMNQRHLTCGQALPEVFGSGVWQLSIDGRTLAVRHQLLHNPYRARSTGRLAVLILAAIQQKLRQLQDGR